MKEVKGYLKTEGKKLVNGVGEEILLRGVGLGSWLLPEGYMWCFPEQGDRPRRIEARLRELIGNERANMFWESYYERYISEEDIKQIAIEGFNSIRVPINARFLIEVDEPLKYNEVHFKMLDELIAWCRKYEIYVILDLHGAPGGQTGTNIDDSENDLPELFTNEKNKKMTIELWKTIAKRYRDEWIVAGYDLLNEPLPEWFSNYNSEVIPLYKEIIRSIREVDKKHMIILEGAHWATDWSIFSEKLDDNLILQFHKYWNNPDAESLKTYLDKQAELGVPIFMGEGGENNKDWYVGAFKLFEALNISWNFWTWKKMNTTNSPCSISMPLEWGRIVDYLKGGDKPDEATAEKILWEYLKNIEFKECIYYPQVVNSIFSRAPVRIPGAFYDYEGQGISFEIGKKNKEPIEFRKSDATNIGFVTETRSIPNFHHGQGEDWKLEDCTYLELNQGDWAVYEVNVKERASLEINLQACAINEKSTIEIYINGIEFGKLEVKNASWGTVRFEKEIELDPGKHKIKLEVMRNPLRIEWLEAAVL